MIFPTIGTFKDVIGGGVNASMYLDSIEPYFDIAHERHIEDWLGTTLYNALADGIENSNLTQAETNLLPYYRKALAWLALYEYMPHATVQISEAGMYRVENENMKSAYKYQMLAVMDNAIVNGYESMEKLILFLETNKATYTDWTTAPGYDKHHNIFLHTAADFRNVHNKRMARHTFDTIRGVVEDVEQFVIAPLLGEQQHAALLNARKTNTWTTETKEKKVIYLINRAVAHYAIAAAMAMNIVEMRSDRIVSKTQGEALNSELVAGVEKYFVKNQHHDDTANRHLKRLRDYLNENLEDVAFQDYKDWQAELAEAEEAYQESRPATQSIPDDGFLITGRGIVGTATGSTTRKGASRI
jgi:hypothetical protein